VPGIVQKFGADKPIDLICQGLKNPIANLSEPTSAHKYGLLSANLSILCGLNVRGEGDAVKFDNEIKLEAVA